MKAKEQFFPGIDNDRLLRIAGLFALPIGVQLVPDQSTQVGALLMAFAWTTYLFIAGSSFGCLGMGIAWGQFRLGWKEIIDAAV